MAVFFLGVAFFFFFVATIFRFADFFLTVFFSAAVFLPVFLATFFFTVFFSVALTAFAFAVFFVGAGSSLAAVPFETAFFLAAFFAGASSTFLVTFAFLARLGKRSLHPGSISRRILCRFVENGLSMNAALNW